jgi:hypothetical protein
VKPSGGLARRHLPQRRRHHAPRRRDPVEQNAEWALPRSRSPTWNPYALERWSSIRLPVVAPDPGPQESSDQRCSTLRGKTLADVQNLIPAGSISNSISSSPPLTLQGRQTQRQPIGYGSSATIGFKRHKALSCVKGAKDGRGNQAPGLCQRREADGNRWPAISAAPASQRTLPSTTLTVACGGTGKLAVLVRQRRCLFWSSAASTRKATRSTGSHLVRTKPVHRMRWAALQVGACRDEARPGSPGAA